MKKLEDAVTSPLDDFPLSLLDWWFVGLGLSVVQLWGVLENLHPKRLQLLHPEAHQDPPGLVRWPASLVRDWSRILRIWARLRPSLHGCAGFTWTGVKHGLQGLGCSVSILLHLVSLLTLHSTTSPCRSLHTGVRFEDTTGSTFTITNKPLPGCLFVDTHCLIYCNLFACFIYLFIYLAAFKTLQEFSSVMSFFLSCKKFWDEFKYYFKNSCLKYLNFSHFNSSCVFYLNLLKINHSSSYYYYLKFFLSFFF